MEGTVEDSFIRNSYIITIIISIIIIISILKAKCSLSLRSKSSSAAASSSYWSYYWSCSSFISTYSVIVRLLFSFHIEYNWNNYSRDSNSYSHFYIMLWYLIKYVIEWEFYINFMIIAISEKRSALCIEEINSNNNNSPVVVMLVMYFFKRVLKTKSLKVKKKLFFLQHLLLLLLLLLLLTTTNTTTFIMFTLSLTY